MPAIILPDKWRRQPTGSIQLDASQGALFAYSAGIVYTQNGVIVPGHSSTGGLEPTPWGLAHKLNGSTNVQRFDTKQTVSGSDAFTIEYLAYATSVTSLGTFATLSNYSWIAGSEHKVNYSAVEAGAMRGDLPFTGSAPYDVTWWNGMITVDTNISHRTNSLDHYVFTKASGTSSPRLSIYRNGELLSQTSPSGAWNTSGPYFYIGGMHEGGTTSITGWVIESVVHRRELSAGEVRERTRAPWAVFKKSARILYFPSAGGGGATITAGSGSFALTGTAVSLKANRVLAAASGSFALTGSDVSLRVGRKLAADSGTYSLTGTDVAFKRGYALSAESGTYTLNGTDVSLKAGRKLTADSGTYALTGTNVTLTHNSAGSYTLVAESGSYSLTGTAVSLTVNRKLAADSGTYALTGSNATLTKGYTLTAASGTYTLTGSNVAFARTYRLTAESGAYTLTGSNASIVWSGAPVDSGPDTSGGGSGPRVLLRERKVREEVDEWLAKKAQADLLKKIQREDEEICLIMALMAA